MPAPDGKVAHAELQIGDSIVMLTEATQEPVTSASIHLYVPNADAVFERAVAAGAQTNMPVTNEDVSPEEIGRRAAQAMR